MVEFNTSIDSARDAIEAILTTKLGAGVNVYDHFPTGGVDMPAVVIQHIGMRDQLWGGGEWQTGSVKAIFLILRLQIDVYTDDEGTRDQYSDNIVEALWDSRSSLKSSNRVYNVRLIEGRDLPPQEPYSNIYRKSLRFDVVTEMTNG